MATYTLTTTAGQETRLSRVATAEGYSTNLAWIEAVLTEAITARDKQNDQRLIGKAQTTPGSLTTAEATRVKTVLGIS